MYGRRYHAPQQSALQNPAGKMPHVHKAHTTSEAAASLTTAEPL